MRLFGRPKCKAASATVSNFMPQARAHVRNKNDDNDDGASIMTYSTMATTGSNRGAGWTVDKYFYQRAGRWIETWASRIGLRYGVIPPSIIAQHLDVMLRPTIKCKSDLDGLALQFFGMNFVEWEFAETNKVKIDNGIDCLLRQLQSPSQSRRAVACAALIWFQSYRDDTLKCTYKALEKRDDTKSSRARAETFSSSCTSSSRGVYSRLLLSFLHECVKGKYASNINLFLESADAELLRMVENVQSSSYDIVLIVHEACVALHKCFSIWSSGHFAEIFYFYMCFLLNVLQRELRSSNASVKEHHIALLPYMHWINSILPSAFIHISTKILLCFELKSVLKLLSLFALPHTRNLFPTSYAETNFRSGPYRVAKERAAIDSSSFEELSLHILDNIGNFSYRRLPSPSSIEASARHTGKIIDMAISEFFPNCVIRDDMGFRIYCPLKMDFSDGTDRMYRLTEDLAGENWLQLIPRFLDQRVWEYHMGESVYSNGLYIDLVDILTDKRSDYKCPSSNAPACSTSGAALFRGDSIPVIEYSRNSQNPMTVAIFCKETGKTIYRIVELSSEEAAALELEEDET